MNTRLLYGTFMMVLWFGCLGCKQRAWTTQDAWYLDCTANIHSFSGTYEIEKRFVHPVRKQTIEAAIAVLADRSFVMLTMDQARQFYDGSFSDPDSRHLFLVRGVYLNWEPGAYTVYRIGNAIHVNHGSLGKKAVPMKKWPIILELEKPPTEVYVTCTMTE